MYFSYFVVHKDSPIQCVSELNESLLFGINGSDSLSGCHSIRFWLHQTKRDHRKYAFFQTGGHAKTLMHIANGTLDCGAIDIVCLLRLVQENPEVWRKIRVLTDTVLGPYPAQPITISGHDEHRSALIDGFQQISGKTMAKAFVSRFEPIPYDTYDDIKKLFQDTKYLQLTIIDVSNLQPSKKETAI